MPTPSATVDTMVERLFRQHRPRRHSRVLDPGCGRGAFIEGILRHCRREKIPVPRIVGIELDAGKLREARKALQGEKAVELICGDFLTTKLDPFDFVVGNPPYVGIEKLSESEKSRYRGRFRTARGRLDLYLLFWERAIELLRPNARLVFITPEKFVYVETARALREILSQIQVEEIVFAPENTFPGLITYPTITTVVNRPGSAPTRVESRKGERTSVQLPDGGESWQPLIQRAASLTGRRTLQEIAVRVSCGVATGADSVFVLPASSLPARLSRFAHPTLAGRELRLGLSLPDPRFRMLAPYDSEGNLLPEGRLGPLRDYLRRQEIKTRLQARTCVRRKPWYAFHETPPMRQVLRPKLLCKDVTSEPYFWIDRGGSIIPRHSVYYVVPHAPEHLEVLAEYLNSADVRSWLRSHCQRAANGFLRIQSSILKRLPVPDELAESNRISAVAV